MSHSMIYDLPRNHLTPGPDLVLTRTPEGLYQASMDFRCVKGDIGSTLVQAKLAKGTPIVEIYPDITPAFSFLRVDDYDSNDQAGGYTIVNVKFKGIDLSNDSEFDAQGGASFTRNDSLQQESIFNNPNFIAEVPSLYTRDTIRMCVIGVCYAPLPDDEFNIKYRKNDLDREDITADSNAKWWYEYIVVKGNHTWEAPVSEWTKSATGKSQLREQDLEDFGWIDNPAGSPSSPNEHEWLFTGATENITIDGDSVNSYGLTWSSGRYEPRVYTKPAQ